MPELASLEPVLIIAPIGGDAPSLAALLQKEGIANQIFADAGSCAEAMEVASVLLLTEEALELPGAPALIERLANQPAWSELPVIVLTRGGESHVAAVLDLAAGNVTLLERPMSAGTLIRSVQVALRTRQRQYQVRDLLAEQERRKEELRRGKELSDAVNRISGLLHSTLDIDAVIKRIVEEGAAALRSDTAAISQRVSGGWVVRYVHGLPDLLVGMVLDDSTERHAVLAMETRAVVPVEDASNDERFNREHFRRHNIRSVLVAPLILRGETFGMVFFNYHTAPHRFDEVELGFARQLASSAASAINNARLFDEERRARDAYRRSEERFRALVTASSEAVYQMSADWGEMRPLHGQESIADIQKPSRAWVQQHILPEDQPTVMTAIDEAVRKKGVFELEYRVRRADGTIGWTFARAVPLLDANGTILEWFGAASDITERKHAEEELQKAKDQLAAANTSLEKLVAERTAKLEELVGELEHFSYTITHDLKAPLRAMKGFAEIATELCGAGVPSEAREALARISRSAERMECLISDALSYSRVVRQELPLANVDLGALLRGLLDTYPMLQPSKTAIQVEGRLPVVLANEAGLTQCFSNLLGNAVKFVRKGEKPQIRIWAEEREGWARIIVEDKGIGVAKEMLPRVFDMFSRGSPDYEGTGIGLALVRKVTQRMGGRVGVESDVGEGSRFWIELRLGEMGVNLREVELAPTAPKGGAVLYVEDEESDAYFMKRAFVGQGLESALQIVRDGRAAIDYLSGAEAYADRQQHPLPSVVLLDLNLPQVSGFEVLKWMRRHPDFSGTPVVVFSSSAREDDRVKALELGADTFVSKPSSGAKFGEIVEMLRKQWLGEAPPSV